MTEPATATGTTVANMTVTLGESSYIVLRDVERSGWVQVITGEVREWPASSADQAIKRAAGEEPGTYVAVPARSWNPRTLKVKTEKKVTLE